MVSAHISPYFEDLQKRDFSDPRSARFAQGPQPRLFALGHRLMRWSEKARMAFTNITVQGSGPGRDPRRQQPPATFLNAVHRSHPLDHAPWRASRGGTPVRGSSSGTAAPSRVKLLRHSDGGPSASLAGRMVISGRMSDVCAELDRLARDS
jgi:hypothetical protein